MITNTAVDIDSGFTYEELRDWLRGDSSELPTAPGFYTAAEWRQRLGCSIDKMREALSMAFSQGRLESVESYAVGYDKHKHCQIRYKFKQPDNG
jgi:hypothetical protein